MIYVPQFSYRTPEGFKDVDFDHFYDGLTSSGPYALPQLVRIVGDSNPTLNIPLRIDADVPFFWRGIKFELGLRNFGIRLRDPWGNFLMPDDKFVPVWLLGYPPQDASGRGMGPCCAIDPETQCLPKQVIYLDIFSFDAVPWTTGGPSRVWLSGVKRYPEELPCGGGVICG